MALGSFSRCEYVWSPSHRLQHDDIADQRYIAKYSLHTLILEARFKNFKGGDVQREIGNG